jgi:hypothetical protein
MPSLRSLRPLLLLLLCAAPMAGVLAQGERGVKVQNLPNFDLRRYHFGFLLSYNTSDFLMKQDPLANFRDSLMVLDHERQPGFNLGIVASLTLNDNISLRFLPTLSFQERVLQYQFKSESTELGSVFYRKPVESTYLEFPLHLKFRSDRINNFAVYAIGGGKVSIDMATQKDVTQGLDDEIVIKLAKYDYSVDVGGGFDFFMPYFKFGIELKTGIGLPNILIDDETRFSRPLESLRSRVWVLTFTFEG